LKLPAQKVGAYFRNPEAERAGILIYGPDPMRTALKRQEVIKALVGPNGEEEMRLSRISTAELRKEPALLNDAVKAQSFFPGPRVAFLEDASDSIAAIVSNALEDWRDGDAQMIITAAQLRAASPLRKLFENHPNVYAAAIYADPPSQSDIQMAVEKAGLSELTQDVFQALMSLSRSLEPGDFQQTLEKITLYKLNDKTPVTIEDIELCAPLSHEAAVDDILNSIAEGNAQNIGPIMERLVSQGIQPVALCIGATRHFKTLLIITADPGGARAGLGRLRPPVFGPRRDRLLHQAQIWGIVKAKKAIEMLTDLDLTLRSAGRTVPSAALTERVMIRLAMMVGR
tara:strand:+ start:3300 stop:4325 length:1026 start_codon:yes stop_codon:yes gene_type:complete